MSRRRSVAITDDTWVRIKLHAVATGRTPSEIVEEACRRLLRDRYGSAASVAPFTAEPQTVTDLPRPKVTIDWPDGKL